MFFSELTQDRFKKFKKVKRAYYSLWILGVAYLISLFAPFVANDKPYVLSYEGHLYFPLLKKYSAKTFGGEYLTEANYLKLYSDEEFKTKGGWMVRPPIPHDPLHAYLDEEGSPPHAPSLKHWLGTDSVARDLLSRLIYGFRLCMSFSLLLTLISSVFGIIIGGLQGYLGGKFDLTLRHGIEVWGSLPFLYVVILLSDLYGRGFFLLIFVMSIFSWIGLSYYMRGEFLKLKNLNYVRVAKALGLGPRKVFMTMLPNALTPVVTLVPFGVIGGISSLTALDFLGFGLHPPTPSWGELLDQGLKNLYAPWITIFTISALFITLLLTTFIGEGVREAFDPKSKSRYE